MRPETPGVNGNSPKPPKQSWPARTRERLREGTRALSNTPRAFRLVWTSSRQATIVMAVLTVVSALQPAAQAWVGKLIVDGVVSAVNSGAPAREGLMTVLPYLAMEFGLILVGTLIGLVRTLMDHLLNSRLTNHINTLIINKALKLDLRYFEDPIFYDRLQNARRRADFSALRIVLDSFLLVQNVITMISLTGLLIRFSPLLALVLFAAVIPSFVAQTRYSSLTFRVLTWRAPESRMLSYIEELLTSSDAVKEVKLFGLGKMLLERYQEMYWKFYDEDRAIAVRRSWASLGWGLLSTLAFYASYGWIVLRAVGRQITLGDMTMYIGIFRQAQNSFRSLFDSITRLYENNLFLDNLFEYLDQVPEIQPNPNGREVPVPIRQGIEFRNVSFRYPGQEEWVLRDINLLIHPEERVALVGLNGAGKTTLVKLLVRFYDPTEGQILLDGVDLREYSLKSLWKTIGVIFQDFVRYQFTVKENIGFGQVDSWDDVGRVKAAAARGGADALVASLPDGYDTRLGRRWNQGRELSGGQWQKIALSRAFMRDCEVLVLDEPTASLDPEAEYEIFRSFGELTRGRIAVFITHRFSTVRMADRIVVVQQGRIVELGRHEELIAANGAYARLFNLQAEGYR